MTGELLKQCLTYQKRMGFSKQGEKLALTRSTNSSFPAMGKEVTFMD
jgi:hypothetical protein